MIGLDHYFDAMTTANGGTLPLDADQTKALQHAYDLPLWVLAGPGTGKTHTLVWLTLKRVLVDGVPPERIFLTTFTRKAAAELESRLIVARQQLLDAGLAEAEGADITQMNIGTLHGLAARALQDNRYEKTLRIRVLADDLQQQFFLRKTRNPLLNNKDLAFWQSFDLHKSGKNGDYVPNKAGLAEAVGKLFNRLTENSIDPATLAGSGDAHLEAAGQAYAEYKGKLEAEHYTDQAHLQQHFLNFLGTPHGKAWLGEGFAVIVDEYQDTNPIQEQLYFKLTGGRPDLTVVGDDDQSLYRFRGAMVESLVQFDLACLHYLSVDPTPGRIYLRENRRSHADIVTFVNTFIGNHPEMQDPNPAMRVRAPDKPALIAKSSIGGAYPAVAGIAEASDADAAAKVATLIGDLKAEGMIEDYSQVALLTFSTKESDWGIKDYADTLVAAGIPLYNPRSSKAHIDESFMGLIGALSFMLDPEERYKQVLKGKSLWRLCNYIRDCRATFVTLTSSGKYAELEAYVQSSIEAISKADFDSARSVNRLRRDAERVVTYSTLLYKLLAFEPFVSHLNEPEANGRMRVLNHILVAFESLFDDGQIKSEETPGGIVQVEKWALLEFYGIFVEGVHDGVNDPEDEEIATTEGAVNVMTMHQSKGLQFEVVIVLRPEKQPWPSDTHTLEDRLAPFVTRPTGAGTGRSRELRAAEDAIRLFFVGYSRAKRLLVVAGALTPNTAANWGRVLGYGAGSGSIQTPSDLGTKLGMRLL